MNKLRLDGTIWLAADMHLGPNSPKTAAAFYAFLKQAKQHSQGLILCGDIFNAWIGADFAFDPPNWLSQAIFHFRDTALDIPVYLMRGNRDFLLDQRLAQYVGAQMLDDQIILETEHHRLLLTHGDELCTDDVAYQRFRRRVRNPRLQQLFLRLPLGLRQRIAGGLRKKSSQKQQQQQQHQQQQSPMPTPYIYDVNENSCIQLLQQQQQQLLIHGHTHRPALHRMQSADGNVFSRVVIPDWEYDHSQPTRSGWVALQADGHIALHRLHQPTLRFKLKANH